MPAVHLPSASRQPPVTSRTIDTLSLPGRILCDGAMTGAEPANRATARFAPPVTRYARPGFVARAARHLPGFYRNPVKFCCTRYRKPTGIHPAFTGIHRANGARPANARNVPGIRARHPGEGVPRYLPGICRATGAVAASNACVRVLY